MQSRLYAAVDLGSNTAKLTIGALDQNGEVVRSHYEAVPVRLGEDLNRQPEIGEAAIRRTLDCMTVFAGKLGQYDLAGLRAVSTEALRQAVNADDVLSLIKARTGIAVEVISGEDEARLSLEALGRKPGEHLAVMNCGGGSTELASLTASGASFRSLDLGALSLSQRFLKSDPPDYVEVRWLADAINDQLAAGVAPAVGRLVAQGGSALNLLALGQAGDSLKLNRQDLAEAVKLLMTLDHVGRRNLATIEAARADSILAGALVHLKMLEYLGLEELEVSRASISDGLIRRQALNLN